MRVIAISGWKGSGKDTAADFLCKNYNYNRLSFAAPLKDMVAKTYNVPREDLDNPTKKEMPLVNYPAIPTDSFGEKVHLMLRDELKHGYWTPRALCILEGSMKRAVYSNFWVKAVAEKVLNNPDKKYVISDLRFKSEADTLRLLLNDALKTIRINRWEFIDTSDPSERDLDDYKFDYYIQNKGKMGNFENQLSLVANPEFLTGISLFPTVFGW